VSLVTTRELTVLRATQESTFDLTGVIKRKSLVSDGAGGFTSSETTVATVACRVAPQATLGGEQVVAGKLTSQAAWLVTLPQGTAIKEMDWIVVGSETYDVVAVRGPRTNETARVCLATKR